MNNTLLLLGLSVGSGVLRNKIIPHYYHPIGRLGPIGATNRVLFVRQMVLFLAAAVVLRSERE
jgi:hypothetical protein